jgi:amino acid adenylation domain-containing protein
MSSDVTTRPIEDVDRLQTIPIQIREQISTPAQVISLAGTLVYRYFGDEEVKLPISGGNAADLVFTQDPNFASLVHDCAAFNNDETKDDLRCFIPDALGRYLAQDGVTDVGPLFLQFRRRNGLAVLELSWSSKGFEPDRLHRLARHCEILLQSATQAPDEPVSRLRMMSEEELEGIVVEQSGTAIPFERVTIPEAFEVQVRRAPNATALIYNGQTISYGELYARAERLASSLQTLDVPAESFVGVYLDDPVDVAVSYFGTVMAGCAFVALDPEWPLIRLTEVIQESGVEFVISSRELAPGVPATVRHVILQEDLEKSMRGVFRKTAITPDSAAYVVFTSGSTGTPKGVVGLHRTITCAPKVTPLLNKNEVCALSANLAFGAGVVGLFFPLLQGAAVLLVSRSTAKDLPALVSEWKRAGVTRIVAVAPQIRQLTALAPNMIVHFKNITTVALAGAVLTPDMLPEIHRLFPAATIINAYSCLEIGSMVTRWVSPAGQPERPLTLGGVLPNIRIFILGPKLNPIPTGMPGEIFIASPDMSREYLNRPELTRERFLANPFGPSDLPRLYRTGDVGRFLPNRELQYVGRMDNQVKVRGIRIELEEVEAALQKKPGIHLAAVVAVKQGAEARLIAFVSPQPGVSLGTSALREHLQASLPPYMVPSLFVLMDHLPMLPNGKIDRQHLPTAVMTRPEVDTVYVAPGNEMEAAVAAIWEKELGIDGIGVEDHFLEIGGDSIIATLISVRIQEQFQVEVPATSLFEFPTVRTFAAELA